MARASRTLGGGRGWVLATRSLLFVGHRAGRAGSLDGSTYPPSLLAIDKATGQVVARHGLPLGPSAPMTYLHQGRQEIVAFAILDAALGAVLRPIAQRDPLS